jgi:peptidoglycan hydrolase-like protein with peptidoglycan-binding domain
MEGEISASSVAKAVEYNREKSAQLGWGAHFDDIVAKVLRLNFTPEESYFAELLADWQAANGLTPDGMLGPGTWARMKQILGIGSGGGSTSSGTLKIPLVNSSMPKGSTYTVSTSTRNYGTPDTIRALQWIAAEWHKRYPDVSFGVRDISQRGGGKISPHQSHRIGLDADVTLTLRSTGERIGQYRPGSGTSIVRNYAAYQHIARDFVALAAQNPFMKIKTIFYFDRSISRLVSTSKDSDTHYRHFHLRFCMPAAYQAQINFGAVYSSGEYRPKYNC